ncbi:MAG: site-2 protease family protein [Acidobacteria bacterium]|nr:site-2 protease family protein [Acidobacteriota bacterium]
MRGNEANEAVPEEATGNDRAGLLVLVGLLVGASLLWGLSTLAVILALVVMIFLHELGHFLTAKAAGMKVTEFFLGFGPRLWSFRRGETDYGVKAIPAGAYVRIIGMSNLDEVDPEDEDRTYRSKRYGRRLSVAVAGSAMHFILALVLIYTAFVGFGVINEHSPRWVIASVTGPALDAGVRPGDRIIGVDGQRFARFADVSKYLRAHPGKTVELAVEGKGPARTITATLGDFNPSIQRKVGYLGVGPRFPRERVNPVEAARRSLVDTGKAGWESVVGIGKLFSPDGISRYYDSLRGLSKDDSARPVSVVGIVQVGSQAAHDGIVNLLTLLFGVNVFIGVFNLTPVLPFDGGHVAIATYEKIRSMLSGREYRADVAKLMPLTYVVVLVLALLFITSLYSNIVDPISVR